MSGWINYRETPPPKVKREYWVYDTKTKRVTWDEYKHRVVKGSGIYADYGYCFSLLLDNNASHYMPMVKGEGRPKPPKEVQE